MCKASKRNAEDQIPDTLERSEAETVFEKTSKVVSRKAVTDEKNLNLVPDPEVSF